MLVLGRFCVD
uniref:Uncharacterized protein n=1 Tax=Arundo donax TaxID=35708 RepID=A0A0A9F2E4_ARUDO